MRVLVACEYSGRVRDAFIRRGHDAMSCDLLPTESPGPHFQGPVEKLRLKDFDLVIAHPPCRFLARSGARWWPERQKEQRLAIEFVKFLWAMGPSMMAIENPVGILSSVFRKPDQVIQPWQFGHGETKATCLWLRGLPPLVPTNKVRGRERKIWTMAPGPERSKLRSLTYEGIAEAMAEQWGEAQKYLFGIEY